jgi:DinB superfamily
MIFQVGVENNHEGRSIAWALEHPGCYAYGTNGGGAVSNLEHALSKYAGWILRHETRPWLSFTDDEIEIVINGTWDVYYINDDLDMSTEMDGYSVDSFFPFDWKPLTDLEITRGLTMLSWSREDLLKSIQGMSPAKLEATYPGERWSIKGILGHVGGAELWYMSRLGFAFPPDQVPEDPLLRLEKVRKHLASALVKLAGVKQVIGVDGEFWSPRKLLRRALWHERDHTEHIRKLS